LVVVGIFVILGGLQNIGVVDLRKKLDFRGDFIFNIVPKFVSFLFGVLSVSLFRNYWGLVIAICVHYVARVAMSYLVVDYRPRWSLSRYRELFGFSGWFLLQGLARFATDQMDRFVIGVLGGPSQVGIYSVAREVGELPVTEVAMPMSRALTPVLAKLNETSDRFGAAIEKALGGVTLVAAPVAIGFVLGAQEFIQILFGEKWLGAVPVATIVCSLALFSSFFTIALNILVVIGRVRQGAILSWIQAVAILAFLYPAYAWRELEGVAMLLVAVGAVMALTVSLYMQHLGLLRGWRTVGNFARPYVAVGCMYMAVTLSQPLIPEPVFLSLMAKAVIGATVYGLAVASLWLAAGRPESTEKVIVEMISAQFSRLQWLRPRSLPG
jgi:O-antigen/teichoic acid export membrane protein